MSNHTAKRKQGTVTFGIGQFMSLQDISAEKHHQEILNSQAKRKSKK